MRGGQPRCQANIDGHACHHPAECRARKLAGTGKGEDLMLCMLHYQVLRTAERVGPMEELREDR